MDFFRFDFGDFARALTPEAASRKLHVVKDRMVSRHAIRKFAGEVARLFKPDRIILFGSYAYGNPTPDSDVDLLVVIPYDRRQGRVALRILEAVDHRFPLDLLVRTPFEVKQRLRWRDCFMEEVLEKGKVLYEAAHPRVGQEGGERF